MRFAAVIFDMDGVLADTLGAYFGAESLAMSEAGAPVSAEFLHSYNGRPSIVMMRDALAPQGRQAEAEKVYARMEAALLETLAAGLKPMPGAAETLSGLRRSGFKLAVASSSSRKIVDGVLSALRMRKHFDAVVSFDDVRQGKPHPEIFLLAASRLGVRPGECVVVEDAKNGIEAAHRAGMKAVGYSGGGCDVSDADWAIGDLRKLEGLL